MLVLSREPGTSIFIESPEETCVITILRLSPAQRTISLLINSVRAAKPGRLESRSVEVTLEATVRVSGSVEVSIVDLREDKARIGINAPPQTSVHRFEVYEAILRTNQAKGDQGDSEGGAAGSPVPRSPSPKPPTLDVRLDEPRPETEIGD